MVIFGEDIAALCGLVFALLAVSLTMLTGNPVYDAVGSIGIGVLLLIIAWMIGIEVKDLIIGQGVEPARYQEMCEYLGSQDSIAEVFRVITLQLGNDVMVAIKARMQPQPSDVALIEAINAAEERFGRSFGGGLVFLRTGFTRLEAVSQTHPGCPWCANTEKDGGVVDFLITSDGSSPSKPKFSYSASSALVTFANREKFSPIE